MSDAPLPPASPRPSERFGRPLDFLWFSLFFFAAFLGVSNLAFILFAVWLSLGHPQVAWPELWLLATRQAQFNAFFAVPVQAALYVFLALFIYLRVRRRTQRPFFDAVAWRALDSRKAPAAAIAGVGLALLIQLGTALFPPPEPLPIDKLITTRAAALLVLGASLLLAPFFEELIFRGYLYGLFEPAWGVAPAVIITGVLFGLLHAPQLAPGWIQVGFLCVVGIVFALARARTGSLRASFLMHFAYNATITALYLAGPEFAQLPPSTGMSPGVPPCP